MMQYPAIRVLTALSIGYFGTLGVKMLIVDGPSSEPILAPITVHHAGSPATLAVVFQPDDCETHAPFIRSWIRAQEHGSIAVVGVPLYIDLDDGDELRARLGPLAPDYPLVPRYSEEFQRLMRKLGYRQTPVAFLLDHAGRVRFVTTSEIGDSSLLELVSLVTNYGESFIR
jgi:hypothetical protein